MKKFTLLIAIFVCAIGYSQTKGSNELTTSEVISASSLGERNAVVLQEIQSPIVLTGNENYLSGEVTFTEFGNSTSVNRIQNTSERSTLVTSNQTRSGGTATFTVLADFQAACSGTLTSEDFSGGPGGITACGPIVSSGGDGCFAAGELEEGFDIQASNGTDVIFIDSGAIGNTSVLMGANTFLESTIINFTGPDDVFSVGHDIWNNSDPDTTYDVYDTGGALMDTFNLNNTVATENFFGIMTDYAIGHIEIRGLNDSGELFGNFLFGDCGGGGGSDCSEENLSNAFENAFTTSSNQDQRIAADITVPADTDMTLNTVTANIMVTAAATFTGVDVVIYDDAAGFPGTILETQAGIVPTSQANIGTAFGLDVLEVVVDIAPYMLNGQAGVPTTYWIALTVTASDGGPGYWEGTTLTVTNNNSRWSPDAGVTWNDNAPWDQVYLFSGDCSDIGGGPGCTVSEDFDAGLPAGWSTVVNTGNCDWQNGTDLPTGDDFPTPGMFYDDDDACGEGGAAPPSNVTLMSDIYNADGATSVMLGYDVAFQEISGDTGTVEVYDGAAWQQVAFYDADLDPDIQTESIDVTAHANADFQVRWTYDDGGGWGWHLGVDNFCLTHDGGAPTGPENDLCENALPVECGETVSGDTTDATDTDNPGTCDTDLSVAPGVWYTLTIPGDDDYTVTVDTLGSEYDTKLGVFSGDCGALVCVAGNDDEPGGTLQSLVEFVGNAGETYTIYVSGWGGNVGIYDLNVACVPLVGTSDNEIEGFSFYPNPSSDVINLSSQDNIERVAIYNILGQKVVDQNINATSSQLNVANLVTGTYLMQVSVDGKTATYKIIKN